jgi:hypothetical protein
MVFFMGVLLPAAAAWHTSSQNSPMHVAGRSPASSCRADANRRGEVARSVIEFA